MCELLGLCFNTEVSVHLYRRFNQKTWVFAHNGTIDRRQLNLPSKEFSPIGETDSELVFCCLLSWLNGHRNIQLNHRSGFVRLHKKLLEINQFGELNLIFSDGRRLFAYHDRSGHVGLHFLVRQAPYKFVRLRGQYLNINLEQVIDPRERGYIVASEPLSNENWIRVKSGRLLIFSEGKAVFTSESE